MTLPKDTSTQNLEEKQEKELRKTPFIFFIFIYAVEMLLLFITFNAIKHNGISNSAIYIFISIIIYIIMNYVLGKIRKESLDSITFL